MITGAGSGIGQATAVTLAAAGSDLLLAGRRATSLEETRVKALAAAPGARIEIRPTDVGDAAECEEVVAAAIGSLGGLDAIVTAAATSEAVPVLEMTAEVWDACHDVALRGSVLVAVAAARHMRDHGGGRIVLLSSVNGFASEPETVHYSAAKAAISSVARSMAVDLAPDSIAVNAVAPGWIDTPMVASFVATATRPELLQLNPLGRLGRAEEIAAVIAYLATEAPGFMTGTTVVVDGGQTAVAPLPQSAGGS